MSKQIKPDIANPYEVSLSTNDSNVKRFHDHLISLIGKTIEVYLGDQSETLNFDEYSVPQNCSIFGKLIDVFDRFIILNCYYIDPRTKQLRQGNTLYVNAFQIRAMSEVNDKGSLADVFLHSKDAKLISKLILAEKK